MIVRQTLEVTSNVILTENVNNKTKQNTIYVQIERFYLIAGYSWNASVYFYLVISCHSAESFLCEGHKSQKTRIEW